MSQLVVFVVVELSRKLLQLLGLCDAGTRSVKGKEEDETDSSLISGTRRPPSLRTRQPSLVEVDGCGQSIAVLTSGGDAQGKSKTKSRNETPIKARLQFGQNGVSS